MRNCVSPLCFKGQVPDLSLFVILKPSPLGEGAPVRTLGRMRGQVPAPSLVGAAHRAARPQQAHSATIPNICIQTSHKGDNSSLFEQNKSLPPCGGKADSPCQGEMAEGQRG